MYARLKTKTFTATPDKYPQKRFNDKPCRECGTVFSPVAPSNLYCSDDCFHENRVNKYLNRNYGVDYAWYRERLKEQNGACKICKDKGFKLHEGAALTLVVDHCHAKGTLRGLLCHNCNRALGLFQDSPEFMNRAIEYLESSTTIPQGSTLKRVEAPDPSSEGDDIV